MEIVTLAAGAVGLIIAVVWAVLPFILISKFNQLIGMAEKIDSKLDGTNALLSALVDKQVFNNPPPPLP